MTADEFYIYNYLKQTPLLFISGRDIARRAAGKRRFREAPDWAKPALRRMVNKEILESDGTGSYRIKPKKEVEADGRRWVSPAMARILKRSDKSFGDSVTIEIEDEPELTEKPDDEDEDSGA